MRSHSQIMMIVTSIAFTMALALIVALLCISYLKVSPPIEEKPVQPTEEPTEPTPAESSTPPSEGTENGTPDTTPDTRLRFASLGNGTCALLDVGSCTDACVVIPEYAPSGERVVEISTRAFYACSTVTAVQIPASVSQIGPLAFANCQNLLYISVDADNRDFCDDDGVLYTRDKRILLLYPARRAQSSYSISRQTVEICDMAFFDCPYLQTVYFEGSAEEWDMIRIGIKNHSLTAAAKQFCAVP